MIAASLLFLLFGLDNLIGRLESLALLAGIVGFTGWTIRNARNGSGRGGERPGAPAVDRAPRLYLFMAGSLIVGVAGLALSVGIGSDSDAIDQSALLLVRAIEIDPTYPDPYCFLGIIERSTERLDVCLAANPPAEVRGLVEALRSEIESGAVDGE